MNSNCFYLLYMRNLQEQVKKAFCYQKLFWPFTFWINCSSDLKILKSFSRSLEQFFLTVGQNNFGNKIPIFTLLFPFQKGVTFYKFLRSFFFQMKEKNEDWFAWLSLLFHFSCWATQLNTQLMLGFWNSTSSCFTNERAFKRIQIEMRKVIERAKKLPMCTEVSTWLLDTR